MKKVLVILGPTATGKTDLALKLAKKFSGELIACDSRQVYKSMDIGTGKLPGEYKSIQKENGYWEIDNIKVWMYDVISPTRQYTVADYVKDADRVIRDIQKRGKLPIVVGGTGLYMKALLEGLPNLVVPVDKKLRNELQKLSLQELQEKLKELSSDKWKGLNESDRQNPRRLLRSIELVLMNPYIGSSKKIKILKKKYQTLKIGLTAPREVLYKKVDLRISSRISQGMVQEAEGLKQGGLSLTRMRQLGLEYGVLANYLDGKIASDRELVKVMQGKIHGYVRRQQTWFKKEKEVRWFDIVNSGWVKKVEKKVGDWYNS